MLPLSLLISSAAMAAFAPQCTPQPGLCYTGDYYQEIRPSPSAESCCQTCLLNTTGCGSWTFHTETASKGNKCCLFAAAPNKGKKCGATSGAGNPRPATPTPPPTPKPAKPTPPPTPSVPTPAPKPAPAGAKNLVWFVVDDLRPSFSKGYRQPTVITPNLDKLAATGTVFEHAYCNFAVCAPSRSSFMVGRRPNTTTCYNFLDHFRMPDIGPDWTSVPEHFKNNGYITLGGGKTFHPNLPPNYDEPRSWTQEQDYYPLKDGNCPNGATYCAIDTKNLSEFFDYRMADRAIGYLDIAANSTPAKPFFIAVGIRRPHVSWAVPSRYWDLYDNVSISLPVQGTMDSSIPDIAWSDEAFGSATMANGTKVENPGPREALPDDVVMTLRRGYFAAVSWADAQMGRVVQAVEDRGFAEDTIIVVHGDHGYQLGEKNCWTKHTNFELGTRVPLIVRAMFKPKSVGTRINATFVELVDLFKTFAELAGLPAPEAGVEGKSFAPVFDDPATALAPVDADVGQVAWAQYDRCPKNESELWTETACKHTARVNISFMGFSMRTVDWRYNVWLRFDGANNRGLWEACSTGSNGTRSSEIEAQAQADARAPFCERELYAHGADEDMADFEHFEPRNLAGAAEYQQVVEALHVKARAFFDPHHQQLLLKQ